MVITVGGQYCSCSKNNQIRSVITNLTSHTNEAWNQYSGSMPHCMLWEDEKDYWFLTGHLIDVLKQYPSTIEKKTYPPIEKRELPEYLRPHQISIIESCLKKVRGVVKSPTGSGKSVCIAELVRQLGEEGNILITVPSRLLLYQMKKDIEEYFNKVYNIDIEVGYVGDGHREFAPITVGIAKSLSTCDSQGWFDNVYTWIFDEVHKAANETAWKLSEKLANRRFSLGFSATPWVNNDLNTLISGLFGPTIVDIEEKDMIDQKVIMQPLILYYNAPKGYAPPSLLKKEYSHWVYNQLYNHLIVNNTMRNHLIAKLADEYIEMKKGPLVIIVNKVGTTSKSGISHAELILDQLDNKLPIIHGGTKSKEQKEVLEALSKYEISGVIAGPEVLSAGVSISSISCLILAGGGRVDNTLIQRIGRVLRVAEGKDRPLVIDFIDPLSYFASQSKSRIDTLESIYPGCVNYV